MSCRLPPPSSPRMASGGSCTAPPPSGSCCSGGGVGDEPQLPLGSQKRVAVAAAEELPLLLGISRRRVSPALSLNCSAGSASA